MTNVESETDRETADAKSVTRNQFKTGIKSETGGVMADVKGQSDSETADVKHQIWDRHQI